MLKAARHLADEELSRAVFPGRISKAYMLLVASILLLFQPPLARAGALEACQLLAKNDPVATDRCLTHVKLFETVPALITACAEMGPTFDIRFRCLKSGADLEIFRLCESTRWSLEARFTCLRAYPTKSILKHCLRRGGTEDEQVQCVRLGIE